VGEIDCTADGQLLCDENAVKVSHRPSKIQADSRSLIYALYYDASLLKGLPDTQVWRSCQSRGVQRFP
jgi:hypothetical protein